MPLHGNLLDKTRRNYADFGKIATRTEANTNAGMV
jgi:hypothetical protein